MLAAFALLAGFGVSTASAAEYLFDWGDDFYADGRSPYVKWMAETQVNGLAAPIGIANQPCFVYEGSRPVVTSCPGAFVAERVGYDGAVGDDYYRRHWRRHRNWVRTRY
jgi:hypothetical protein